MPNGEFNPVRNAVLSSATPSPFASRSSVMRLAEGTAAPALAWNFFMALPLMPLPCSGRSGALVSATSTSPFGSVYTQRGCASPLAKAVTVTPAGAVGFMPGGQPLASATCTVGTVCLSGLGRLGFGPTVVTGDAAGPRSEVPTLQAVRDSRVSDAASIK